MTCIMNYDTHTLINLFTGLNSLLDALLDDVYVESVLFHCEFYHSHSVAPLI